VTGWLAFRWSEDPSTWRVPSTLEDPACSKQVSSGSVRELKIQRKSPGSAL